MKNMLMKKTAGWLAAGMLGASLARADESGFQASLTPEVAIKPDTTEIDGVALSVWGENPQTALALGFINGSTGESEGLSLGLVNYADSYTGVALGLANVSSADFTGWQSGVVNVCQGTLDGFQTGVLNLATEGHGLQLGLVNYSGNLNGVQIGLCNVALNNPWFTGWPRQLATGFPVVNWSF